MHYVACPDQLCGTILQVAAKRLRRASRMTCVRFCAKLRRQNRPAHAGKEQREENVIMLEERLALPPRRTVLKGATGAAALGLLSPFPKPALAQGAPLKIG